MSSLAVTKPLGMLPTSSETYLQLLTADQPSAVRVNALSHLLPLVDYFWHEMASHQHLIKAMVSEEAPAAALLLSKINFHLEQYDQAVEYALQAGDLFDRELNSGSSVDYVGCIVGKAIDGYCQARQEGRVLPKGWESLVERILQRSMAVGQWSQALGLALDARRLDVVEAILQHDSSLARQAFELSRTISLAPDFEQALLMSLLGRIGDDLALRAECLLALGAAEELAKLLAKAPRPVALQLAFDLVANASPSFRLSLVTPDLDPAVVAILGGGTSASLNLSFLHRANHSDMLVLERVGGSLTASSSLHHQAMAVCNGLMQQGTTNDDWLREHQDWLKHATNWAKFTTVASIGLIHRGNQAHAMTVMGPYLPNIAEVSKLSGDDAHGGFAEAGALLAMGLIYADQPSDQIKSYLAPFLDVAQPTIQHGAALAVGIQSLGTGDEALSESLKAILYSDDAVAGEGAALALGLLWMGQSQAAANLASELRQYAEETQHEKIIRAIGLALALISFQSHSLELAQSMLASKDPLIRYGGAWSMAMAWIGTGCPSAIRTLMHTAVSDASEDVRRAAVMALGPVLLRAPQDLLRLLRLLITSHSGQVRHGAIMALAVAFAATADHEALQMIRPLLNDSTDYVRQAAYLACAMICQLQADKEVEDKGKTASEWNTMNMNPAKKEVRQMLLDAACAKGEEALARWGAIVGLGWLDAGGRNQRLSLLTPMGRSCSPLASAAWLLSCQSWYWYPLGLFGGLTLQPLGLIGVTETLEIPKAELMQQIGNVAMFAYPAPLKPPQQATAKALITAVLSTGKNRSKSTSKKMDIDETPQVEAATATKPEEASPANNMMEVDQTPLMLHNLQRITPAQASHVTWLPDGRWKPLVPNRFQGILILTDSQPGQPFERIEQAEAKQQAPSLQPKGSGKEKKAKKGAPPAEPKEEAAPPAPFKLDE